MLGGGVEKRQRMVAVGGGDAEEVVVRGRRQASRKKAQRRWRHLSVFAISDTRGGLPSLGLDRMDKEVVVVMVIFNKQSRWV